MLLIGHNAGASGLSTFRCCWEIVGQVGNVGNLRPIVNRPLTLREDFFAGSHNEHVSALHVRRPEIASRVADAICRRDTDTGDYRLHAYVVMPNHVHILITPHVQVSRLMQSLKRLTARQGNRMLTLTGHPFWQDESCDRLVRSQMTAGLAASPEQFAWSSGMPIHNRPQLKCRNSSVS